MRALSVRTHRNHVDQSGTSCPAPLPSGGGWVPSSGLGSSVGFGSAPSCGGGASGSAPSGGVAPIGRRCIGRWRGVGRWGCSVWVGWRGFVGRGWRTCVGRIYGRGRVSGRAASTIILRCSWTGGGKRRRHGKRQNQRQPRTRQSHSSLLVAERSTRYSTRLGTRGFRRVSPSR